MSGVKFECTFEYLVDTLYGVVLQHLTHSDGRVYFDEVSADEQLHDALTALNLLADDDGESALLLHLEPLDT